MTMPNTEARYKLILKIKNEIYEKKNITITKHDEHLLNILPAEEAKNHLTHLLKKSLQSQVQTQPVQVQRPIIKKTTVFIPYERLSVIDKIKYKCSL